MDVEDLYEMIGKSKFVRMRGKSMMEFMYQNQRFYVENIDAEIMPEFLLVYHMKAS
jgi:hypothetical protein